MYPMDWKSMCQVVARVCMSLDVIEGGQISSDALLMGLSQEGVRGPHGFDALELMERKGLLTIDGPIVAITEKGRRCASDCRRTAEMTVR